MGNAIGGLFEKRVDRNVLILGREGVGKSYLLYRLMGLTSNSVELEPTLGFNHERIPYHQFRRVIDVWDPSGKESHRSLWRTYYANAFFNVIVYVIDAKEYDFQDKKRKEYALSQGLFIFTTTYTH